MKTNQPQLQQLTGAPLARPGYQVVEPAAEAAKPEPAELAKPQPKTAYGAVRERKPLVDPYEPKPTPKPAAKQKRK